MQKEQALKTLKNVCEKAQKNGLIKSLDESNDVISAFTVIATNLVRYEQELTKLKEQNEAFKSTNNELLSKVEKLKQENEALKNHIDYKNEDIS